MGSKNPAIKPTKMYDQCAVAGCLGKAANRTGGHCLDHYGMIGPGPMRDKPSSPDFMAPRSAQAILNREHPITPPQKIAVCYRNRPHDSLAGVPFAVWQELSEWLWSHPDGIDCTVPNMIGLKAPDAVAIELNGLLRQIDGEDRSRQMIYLSAEHRILWVYPKG